MTTKVELWNLALGHIRAAPVLSDTEQSVPAQYCRQFYQLCLDTVLTRAPWTFSTAWVPLALLATPQYGWEYSYATPTGFLRIWGVTPAGGREPSVEASEKESPFALSYDAGTSNRVLSTHTPCSAVHVSYRVDIALLPPDVVLAVSHLLARYLSVPLAGADAGTKLMGDQNKLYEDAFLRATGIDATMRNLENPEVKYISGRW